MITVLKGVLIGTLSITTGMGIFLVGTFYGEQRGHDTSVSECRVQKRSYEAAALRCKDKGGYPATEVGEDTLMCPIGYAPPLRGEHPERSVDQLTGLVCCPRAPIRFYGIDVWSYADQNGAAPSLFRPSRTFN